MPFVWDNILFLQLKKKKNTLQHLAKPPYFLSTWLQAGGQPDSSKGSAYFGCSITFRLARWWEEVVGYSPLTFFKLRSKPEESQGKEEAAPVFPPRWLSTWDRQWEEGEVRFFGCLAATFTPPLSRSGDLALFGHRSLHIQVQGCTSDSLSMLKMLKNALRMLAGADAYQQDHHT